MDTRHWKTKHCSKVEELIPLYLQQSIKSHFCHHQPIRKCLFIWRIASTNQRWKQYASTNQQQAGKQFDCSPPQIVLEWITRFRVVSYKKTWKTMEIFTSSMYVKPTKSKLMEQFLVHFLFHVSLLTRYTFLREKNPQQHTWLTDCYYKTGSVGNEGTSCVGNDGTRRWKGFVEKKKKG